MTQKSINLKNGGSIYIDTADYETVKAYAWSRFDVGSQSYARATVNGKQVLLHRFLTNPKPEQVVDHINHSGLDNRRSNLRVCSRAENNRNSKRSKNNTSGFIGVSYKKTHKLWVARITIDRKEILVGYYRTALEAHQARLAVIKTYHKEFAYEPDKL